MLGFKQNQKITSSSHRIPYLGREFTISFSMVVKQPTAKWENVIHVGQGDKWWPRIPAVFIGTGNKLQVHMQHLWKRSDTVLKTNNVMKIDISQTLTPKQVYMHLSIHLQDTYFNIVIFLSIWSMVFCILKRNIYLKSK